jgi:hypothetical protein
VDPIIGVAGDSRIERTNSYGDINRVGF